MSIYYPQYMRRSMSTIASLSISIILLFTYILFAGDPQHYAFNLSNQDLTLVASNINNIAAKHPTITTWLSIITITLGAISLTNFAAHKALYPTATRIPTLIYAALSISIIATSHSVATSLAAIIISTFSTTALLSTEGCQNYHKLFEGSIYLGIIPLIFPSTMLCCVALLSALLILDKSPRGLVIATIGMVIPLATICYLEWMVNDIAPKVIISDITTKFFDPEVHQMTYDFISLIALLGTMAIVAIVAIFRMRQLPLSSEARRRLHIAQMLVLFPIIGIPLGITSIDSLAAIIVPFTLILIPALINMPWRFLIPLTIVITLLTTGAISLSQSI